MTVVRANSEESPQHKEETDSGVVQPTPVSGSGNTVTDTCALQPDDEADRPPAPPVPDSDNCKTADITADLPSEPLPPMSFDDLELERLRALLLAPDRELLRRLQLRLDDPMSHAKEISDVLAEAIILRAANDDRLAKALQPTVEDIFRASVRRDPDDLVQTIFPLMGPAIRKSIAETFHGMLQGLNKALEMAFSWQGICWRFEAVRSGKSYSEIVLLHTLVYRVEQVFLIHAETGLVLGHVTAEGVNYQDADLVSGMLTAVQDFVRDCFAQGEESLDTLQMGERTIVMEKGRKAVLACVVRGTLPANFRGQLRDTLDIIHIKAKDGFASFNGDTSAFASIRRHLDDCLVARYADNAKPLPIWIKALPTLLLLAIISWPTFLWWENKQFTNALNTLNDIPGIVINGVQGGFIRGRVISLMRDPMAPDPTPILQDAGYGTPKCLVHETKYTSLDPTLVTTRVNEAIQLPESVVMSFADGVMRFEGTAPFTWIQEAVEKSLAIPGVTKVDTSQVSDPRMVRLKGLVQKVESTRIEFPVDKDFPIPQDQQKLTDVITTLADLSKLCSEMGFSATLIIYGHTDSTGSDKRNYILSQGRATTLASMLYSRGVAMSIATYGFGAMYLTQGDANSPEARQASRRIELKVHISYLGKSLVSIGE